jgi:ATP-dependent Zn protease
MTGLTRARLLGLAALAALCLALAMPASGLGAATPTYTKETQQEFEKQLKSHDIASVTVNKRLRSLRITLKNGQHFLYHYAKKGEPKLVSELQARHVTVTVLKPAEAAKEVKPAKHKLRYIAGGILIVVVLIVGVVLLVNRTRQRD